MTVTSFFNTYGSFLGALIGAGTPMVAVYIAYLIRKSNKRKTTRTIIKADLEMAQKGFKQVLETLEKESDSKKEVNLKEIAPTMSQVVLKSLIDQIAELTPGETGALVAYYKTLDTAVKGDHTVERCIEMFNTLLEMNEDVIKHLKT